MRKTLITQGFASVIVFMLSVWTLNEWRSLGKPHGFCAQVFSIGVHTMCGIGVVIGVCGMVATAIKMGGK